MDTEQIEGENSRRDNNVANDLLPPFDENEGLPYVDEDGKEDNTMHSPKPFEEGRRLEDAIHIEDNTFNDEEGNRSREHSGDYLIQPQEQEPTRKQKKHVRFDVENLPNLGNKSPFTDDNANADDAKESPFPDMESPADILNPHHLNAYNPTSPSAPLLASLVNQEANNYAPDSPYMDNENPKNVIRETIHSREREKDLQETEHLNMVKRNRKVIDQARRVGREATMLQKFIYKNANPDPYKVALTILIVCVLLWLVYYVLLRENLDGDWVDTSGVIYTINQNMIFNTLHIKSSTDDVLSGRINGNLVVINNSAGMWDGSNCIVINGDKLKRVIN